MENNTFYYHQGFTMPIGWGKNFFADVEKEALEETDSEEELQCKTWTRNESRAKQCREARGEMAREPRWHFLLEADWPTIIIGMWLYMFPFLIGFAALILEKVW